MALISVAAAKGSPGVTTTALALGALWPRQVLVAECDAAGADIPLRMPSVDGGVIDPDRGLLSLAAAGRKGMSPELVLAHTQRIIGGLDVLAGVRVAEQAAGMTNVWPVLGAALDSLPGHDVIADLGRIGATTPQSALLRASRMLVMVTTAEPSAVVHLRERLAMLAPTLDPSSPVGTPISVVVIAPPRQTDAVDQVRDALQRTEVPVQAVWHVAHDDKGAGFFRGHFTGRADRTLLVRSARSVTEQLATAVAPFFRPGGEAGTDDSVPDAAVTAPPEPSAPSKVRDESAPGVTR